MTDTLRNATLVAFVWCLLVPQAFARGPDLMGEWITPGDRSRVKLEPCAAEPGVHMLCGTIVWLHEPLNDDGVPHRDENNPDLQARKRLLVGTQILTGFVRDEDGVWRDGRVYNPDDGRTYSGSIRQTSNAELELRGCALRIFCQTQVWRR